MDKLIQPYVIAIPSYKRYKILIQQTLKTLYLNKIDNKLIYLFVANKLEKQKYTEYISSFFYNENKNNNTIVRKTKNKKLSKKNNSSFVKKTRKSNISVSKKNTTYSNYIKNIKFIVGKKGLKNQRNFISNYFVENQCILQLDDDIKDILQLDYDKLNISNRKKYKLVKINNLHKFIIDTFLECKNNNIYLWGIYPVNNSYFMTPKKSYNLKFIVGPMFGVINRKNNKLRITIDEKENVERTLKYFILDKKILRINYVTVNTNYFKNPGGMQNNLNKSSRKKAALKSAEYLHKKYPHLTKIYLGKKSGWPEIKLKNINSL